MPDHLRSLAVVMFFAAFVFVIAKGPASVVAMDVEDFRCRRNAWIGVTLAAFLAHNFWLFIIAAALIVHWAERRDNNKMACYHFLLFAVPALSSEISGLGVIQHFFSINPLRLLALVILLPAWFDLRARADTPVFGSLYADRFLFGYLFVSLALQLTIDTFTNTLRYTFYAFIDTFLPYYVASRSLRDLPRMRDALMAFTVATLLMVPVAVFESVKYWLLYTSLNGSLGIADSGVGSYLGRGEILRAMASVQHPIVLGYVMAVAVGLFMFLRRSLPSRLHWLAGCAALVAGLIAPVSRGPWVGALVVIIVFIVSDARAAANLFRLTLVAAFSLPLLLSPLGEDLVRYLPFVGDVEVENITYRQRLIEVAIDVVFQNPWFGAYDYFYSPAIQSLKQGQGIIDIVNSYVGILLSNGLVGLSMFVMFFLKAMHGVVISMLRQPDKSGELHLLGQALLASVAGILIMIFTVSGISVIPTIYWSIGGMCVAYAAMMAPQPQAGAVPPKRTTEVMSTMHLPRALRGNQ